MKNMSSSFLLLGVGAFSLCSLIIASSAFAVQEVSARPILYVHGFNPLGLPEDCQGVWGAAESELTAQGFTGQMVTVGYYADDVNCDIKSSPKGSIMTSIPDLAHDFAWTVYNGWSSKQTHVDIVAHSLGGLIVRYAIYRTAIGDPTYPPFMIADHVVTMGSPYEGYSLLAFSCYVNPLNVQCWEMAPYSDFIKDLKAPAALLPEGLGGTLWTNIGSNGDVIDSSDGVVGSGSATSMPIPASSKTIIPWYKLVFHTTYYHHSFVVNEAAAGLVKTAESQVAGPAETPAALPAPDESVCTASKPVPVLTGAVPAAKLTRAEFATDFLTLPTCQRPGRFAPNIVNGDQHGVLVSQILAGGLFDRMGLQNGDVLVGCHSNNLNHPLDAIEAVIAGTSAQFTYCVVRGGKPLTHKFSVE